MKNFFFYKIKNKIFYVLIFALTLNFIFYKNFTLKINLSNFMSIRLYNSMNILMIIFLILYLLLTLICVVKLVKFEYGPLIKRL